MHIPHNNSANLLRNDRLRQVNEIQRGGDGGLLNGEGIDETRGGEEALDPRRKSVDAGPGRIRRGREEILKGEKSWGRNYGEEILGRCS